LKSKVGWARSENWFCKRRTNGELQCWLAKKRSLVLVLM
jgi:hypothetical protein